ncbi:hypothetical protein BDV96DRAFT_668333 [Lophiotrema nucula]|uniref:Homeobox domain-containing protein n=1 Tax=Lophiotrema nucula TaxID=690887 RepID=A0A6A5ZQS6_9PLEO|nr:hypothetical protein BDV96DRAFT_668333 [Lophiotrema nucula]
MASDDIFSMGLYALSDLLVQHNTEPSALYPSSLNASANCSPSWLTDMDGQEVSLDVPFDELVSALDVAGLPLAPVGNEVGLDDLPRTGPDDNSRRPMIMDAIDDRQIPQILVDMDSPRKPAKPSERKKASSKRQTKRTRITAKIKQRLNFVFRNNPYPSNDDMNALSREHGLPKGSIKNWFANTRARRNPQDHVAQSISEQALSMLNSTGEPTSSLTISRDPLDRFLASSPEEDHASPEEITANIAAAAIERARKTKLSADPISMSQSDHFTTQAASVTDIDALIGLPSEEASGEHRSTIEATQYDLIPGSPPFRQQREMNTGLASEPWETENVEPLPPRSPFSGYSHLFYSDSTYEDEGMYYKYPPARSYDWNIDDLHPLYGELGLPHLDSAPDIGSDIGWKAPGANYDSGSNAGSTGSTGSVQSVNSVSSRGSRKGRRRWKANPSDDPSVEPTPGPYHCTFPGCGKTFISRYEWTRHEESVHYPQKSWVCCKSVDMSLALLWNDPALLPSTLLHILQKLFSTCLHRAEGERTFSRKD